MSLPQSTVLHKRKLRTDVDWRRLYLFRPQFSTVALPARGRARGPARLLAWLAQAAVREHVLDGLAFRTERVARVLGVSTRTCRSYLSALAKSQAIAILPAGHVGLRVRLLAGHRRLLPDMPRSGHRCIRARRRGTEPKTTHSCGVRGGAARPTGKERIVPGRLHPTKGYLVASPQARRAAFSALARYVRGKGRHVTGPARSYALERTLTDVAKAELKGRTFRELHAFAVSRLDTYAMQFNARESEAHHEQLRLDLEAERTAAAPPPVAPHHAPKVTYAAILAAFRAFGVPLAQAREAAHREYERLATEAASPRAGLGELLGAPRNASPVRRPSPGPPRRRPG